MSLAINEAGWDQPPLPPSIYEDAWPFLRSRERERERLIRIVK
jgi:hypothetical protein